MESEPASRPGPDEASLALADALDARHRLADSLVLPSYFFSSIGAAIAVQIASSAAGIASQDLRGWLLLIGGWVVLGAVAVVQLTRFRRSNGVRVAGLTGRVVLGTSTAASVSYAAGLAAGVWSALQGVVSLLLVSSLAGGAAYAWSGRRWWLGYRRDPAANSRGESGMYLVCLSVLALAGAVVLLTAG